MTPGKRNWIIGPWSVWRARIFDKPFRHEGELVESLWHTAHQRHPFSQKVEGARIDDHDKGLTYEATIGQGDGQVWLESLTIIANRPGQRIDHALLNGIPTKRIAEQVQLHLAEQQALREQTGSRRAFVIGQESPVVGRTEPPTMDELAELVTAGETRGSLAKLFGVSPSAVDNWLGKARRAGVIKPATTGRPRRPQTVEQSADEPARPNRGRAKKPNQGTENKQ